MAAQRYGMAEATDVRGNRTGASLGRLAVWQSLQLFSGCDTDAGEERHTDISSDITDTSAEAEVSLKLLQVQSRGQKIARLANTIILSLD